ncbi:MAG TPA: EamA family transporter [Bryobacteraceae bacterium]|nr:EamA family transporter [Bryobacteraceae bacterium]
MRKHPHFLAFLALFAVCFFWGTTYLGIRMALESFPPAMLVCIRYLLSGTILTIFAWSRKAYLPRGKELLGTVIFGLITIGLGNGCLAWAELLIPSGMAALFVTLSPFWMVGMEALIPGGARLHGPTIAGMLIGMAGTALLVAPSAIQNGVSGPVFSGFLLLQLGSWGWSIGSILQRRHRTKAHPVVSGAIQQLATGVAYLIPAFALPRPAMHWSARSVGAIVYLVIFGSIVGYSAFIYVMNTLPVSLVTIYNYINPIIAVLLGWLIYREVIGWRELAAMGIIFLGVWVVKHFGDKAAAATVVPAVALAKE